MLLAKKDRMLLELPQFSRAVFIQIHKPRSSFRSKPQRFLAARSRQRFMVPTSNLQDPSGRPFASSYSSQSAAGASGYHHSGGMQGLHNNYGGFNVQNMPGSLASRNAMAAAIGGVPSGNLQQPGGGGISGGRFGSSTLPIQMSQIHDAESLPGR